MSRRAVAGTVSLPKITPLALKRRPEAFDNPDWLYEVKYDGFRALLEIDGSGARLVLPKEQAIGTPRQPPFSRNDGG